MLISIRNIDDVYAALKDSEILAKVLGQGLEEEYLSRKEFIIRLFMSKKDKIRKEDLTVYEPVFASNILKGNCIICQGIRCVNCKTIWLCVNHWREHKMEGHTF